MSQNELILVTGAGGFIGSHLVEELLQQGREVRAFLRYTSHASRGCLGDLPADLGSGLEIFYGDIRDPRAVREAVRGCSTVYHLAALVGIPYSYLAPQSYVEVNILGTLNILDAARDLGIRKTVITSTSEVYGTALYTPMDEQHPLQGQSPYAASKIGADHLALSYYMAFGLPVTVVRPFNTFGPRQSARAVIPTILSQALASERIRLGSLSPVRDLVFVKDTATGFIALAGSEAAVGKVTNLATGRGVSIGELVGKILEIAGRKLPVDRVEERLRPERSEVLHLLGSAELAAQRAGWAPRTSLEEGLALTLTWVEANLERFQMDAYRV